MRKFIIAIVCFVLGFVIGNTIVTHAGGFKLFDNVWAYTNVVIKLGDYSVSGRVDNWRDYNDSDAVQVTVDGVTYLTSYENVVLIYDPKLD